MIKLERESISEEYYAYISNKKFPCVAARTALARKQAKCMVFDHMACPHDDVNILQFLYDFIDEYRASTELFHSAAIIFRQPEIYTEEIFETLLWQRLQSLSDLDMANYGYDERVHADPTSPDFSFSIKKEAFFIIGLHPASSRLTRRFKYPTLTFNPHAQFDELRANNQYVKMKNIVRKRDIAYSGSINPMLEDFGKSSEVYQYSGRQYDDTWKCPLKINHADNY